MVAKDFKKIKFNRSKTRDAGLVLHGSKSFPKWRPPTHGLQFRIQFSISSKMKRFPRNQEQSIEMISPLRFRQKKFEIM